MADFVLLRLEVILAIHEEQLAIHGGGAGIRDAGMLESALARPSNHMACDPGANCATLAADYAFGIARNHPFIDGNKRTAFVAMELCLIENGYRLNASAQDSVLTMLDLASGRLDEHELAAWIRLDWAEA